MPHLLDRPVWNALHSGWADLAYGNAQALWLDPEYGPFSATDGTIAGAATLRTSAADGQLLWLVETATPPLPVGIKTSETILLQMVANTEMMAPDEFGVRQLGDDDATQMRELATLTAPGPFLAKTHRIGDFIGVFDRGRLVAMAGTRMRMPAFAEVSGVCTHPDARGKGYAARLSRLVAARLQTQGLAPFLHCYAGNVAAVQLYTALGFSVRREMRLYVFNNTHV